MPTRRGAKRAEKRRADRDKWQGWKFANNEAARQRALKEQRRTKA